MPDGYFVETTKADLNARITADLRTDHAGETGAVMIYRGILAVSRDAVVRRFAEEHLATEQQHLEQISQLLPPKDRSVFLPLWRIAGFLTGALPALFGQRAVFATIEAVETFVDHHYQQQIDYLTDRADCQAVLKVLRDCQADEQAHRDDAAGRLAEPPRAVLKAWTKMVGSGSKLAVSIARWA